MDLRYRKLINNGGLPKFLLGTEPDINENIDGVEVVGNNGFKPTGILSYKPDKIPTPNINVPKLYAFNKYGWFPEYSDQKVQALPNNLSVIPQPLKPGEAVIKNAPSGKDLMTNQDALNKGGKKLNWGKVGDAAGSALLIGTSALGFYGAVLNARETSVTSEEMVRNAGQSSVDGQSYEMQSVDSSDAMRRARNERRASVVGTMGAGAALGASVGNLFPGAGTVIGGAIGAIGGLIGGLFASRRAKRRAEAAKREATRSVLANNEYGYNDAFTSSLRQKEALNYGDSENLMLYHAANGLEAAGRDSNWVFTKKRVFTPDGVVNGGFANANVDKNERLVRENEDGTYSVQKVTEGPNDSAFAAIDDRTTVVTAREKNPETGNTYAEDVEDYIRQGRFPAIKAGLRIQRELKNTKNMINYKKNMYFTKNKFIPKLAGGWENLAINGLGALTSIGDYINHKSQDIYNPNITPNHPFKGRILELMDSRRPNAYPIMQDMFEHEAGERFRTNASGGLSTGLRTLANMTNSMNTRLARANALLNVLNMYNQFLKENADRLDLLGTSLMNANQQADIFNAQALAASGAKKADLMMNDKYNFLNYATQFAKNNWEREQFDRSMDLYWEKVNADKQAASNGLNNNSTPKTWSLVDPVSSKERVDNIFSDRASSLRYVNNKKGGFTTDYLYNPENILPKFMNLSGKDIRSIYNPNLKIKKRYPRTYNKRIKGTTR